MSCGYSALPRQQHKSIGSSWHRRKKSRLTLSQVLDDVFTSSGSEDLGESSIMISEDEGDVIFRRPPGRGAVLTDTESELDGESSGNSSRSASFDQDTKLH